MLQCCGWSWFGTDSCFSISFRLTSPPLGNHVIPGFLVINSRKIIQPDLYLSKCIIYIYMFIYILKFYKKMILYIKISYNQQYKHILGSCMVKIFFSSLASNIVLSLSSYPIPAYFTFQVYTFYYTFYYELWCYVEHLLVIRTKI